MGVPAQTGFSGLEDGLRPVGYLQLGEDVRDVVAYGFGAHEQEPGNFGVVVALGYEVEYFALAGGQLGERLCGKRRAGGGERVRDPLNVKPEQMGVSSLPVGGGQRQSVNCLGGENLVINTSSEMQDEAWEFVRFATDEEGQKLRLPHNTPTLKTLYRDHQVLEEMPVISVC